MNSKNLDLFKRHAASQYPKEACGLLVLKDGVELFVACANISTTPSEHFVLDPKDYLKASLESEIVAICHTHPDYSAQPSLADKSACEASHMPWYILSYPVCDLHYLKPCGFKAPLLGRPFVHGIHDCYSLCQDYYKEIGILIPHYDRPDKWWDNGMDLYEDNFRDAGFVEVDKPQLHDAVLMRIRSKVSNHAAVFHKPDCIIHHLYDQLSHEVVYGGFWAKVTSKILRHKSLI